jgi:hypothetical protein
LQGMGKSGLIENLVVQDIKQGLGLCVLDPHYNGGIIDNIIARLPANREQDVILLDIRDYQYPFGLNLFACSDLNNPIAVQEVVDRVLHVFDKLLGVTPETPMILQYLRNCTYTLIANPGYTMADILLLLSDKQCRQKLVANVTNPNVLLFWKQYDALPQHVQEERSSSLQRRVEEFLQPLTINIVGQVKSTIDFRAIMDDSKILLVKLDSLQLSYITSLIGSLIIAAFLTAAPTRLKKQNLFNIYADEFQRFATEDFATLLEEARKAGIGITMAHQNRAQLELSDKQADAELKKRTLNVGNIVVFRIPTDAHELAGQFDTTPLPSEMRLEQVQTPVTDVLGWLSSGRAHPDPKVNHFMKKVFTPMIQAMRQHHGFPQGREAQQAYDYLNPFFYKVMLESDKAQQEIKSGNPSKNAILLMDKTIEPDNATFFLDLDPIPLNIFFGMVRHSSYNFRSIIHILECAQKGDIQDVLPQNHDNVLKSIKDALDTFPKYWGMDFDFNIYKLEGALFEYAQAQGMYSQPITNCREQITAFTLFIKELKDFINGLFFSPIMDASGHYEEKPVPRTFADMQNDIANELVRLPKFTAWVKLTNDKDIVVEHTLATREPEKGVYGRLLQERIERIKEQNKKPNPYGYTRPSQEVENEIAQRQLQCRSVPVPIQPQQLPQPQGRLMPICKKCGSQNQPGANFCNQCGEKL